MNSSRRPNQHAGYIIFTSCGLCATIVRHPEGRCLLLVVIGVFVLADTSVMSPGSFCPRPNIQYLLLDQKIPKSVHVHFENTVTGGDL